MHNIVFVCEIWYTDKNINKQYIRDSGDISWV